MGPQQSLNRLRAGIFWLFECARCDTAGPGRGGGDDAVRGTWSGDVWALEVGPEREHRALAVCRYRCQPFAKHDEPRPSSSPRPEAEQAGSL